MVVVAAVGSGEVEEIEVVAAGAVVEEAAMVAAVEADPETGIAGNLHLNVV